MGPDWKFMEGGTTPSGEKGAPVYPGRKAEPPHLPGAQVPSKALVWSHHGLYHLSGFSGGLPNTPVLCILCAAVNVLSSGKSTG